MNHQRPKVVPGRVVLVGLQVALDKVVRNTAVHWRVVRKTADLDRVVLENWQGVLGHHNKRWYPKQRIMEPRLQLQVEMAKVQGNKYELLENRNNDTDLGDPNSEELVNIDRMPPLLEWN